MEGPMPDNLAAVTKALGSVAETIQKINERAEAEKSTWLTPPQVEHRLRDFLETWPLYRRLRFKVAVPVKEVSFPRALSMRCSQLACKNEPTTTWKAMQSHGARPGEIHIYGCVHCERAQVSFWLMTGADQEVPPPP